MSTEEPTNTNDTAAVLMRHLSGIQEEFDFADAMPRVTFAQALEMAEIVGQKVEPKDIPEDPENTWLTFQEFVAVLRPDPEQPVRKLRLNEMHDSFDEWDRRQVGALTFLEYEQLARYYNIEVGEEEKERWKNAQISFQDFVEWFIEKGHTETEINLNAARRYFNKLRAQYTNVTPEHAREMVLFLGLDVAVCDSVLSELGDVTSLFFGDFVRVLIPGAEKQFNMVMMNELKVVFEEGDADNNRVLDSKEFHNMVRYLALSPQQVKSLKFHHGTVNFHEFVMWYSNLKPQNYISFNILKRRFDENDPDELGMLMPADLEKLAVWFGRRSIPSHIRSLKWIFFEEFAQVVTPNPPHILKIAPLNELKHEFDREVGENRKTGEYPPQRMPRMAQLYGVDGLLLKSLTKEPISFHAFVEWYCKELDLVEYKARFDKFNNNEGDEMSKDTFKKVLTEYQIKLTPMERNEVFADAWVSLDEFMSVLKSRDIEYLQIPEDYTERLIYKMSKISLNVLKLRFDEVTGGSKFARLAWKKAEELSRYFCVSPPEAPCSPPPQISFAEFVGWIIKDKSHPYHSMFLNEMKAAFDDADGNSDGRLGPEECEILQWYLGIPQPIPQTKYEGQSRVSFQEIIDHCVGIEFSIKMELDRINILKRRFDDHSPDDEGRLPPTKMTQLCRHFGATFNPNSFHDEPYYFQEFLSVVLPDELVQGTLFNDIKTTFDDLHGKPAWVVPDTDLTAAIWYYCKHDTPQSQVDPETNRHVVTFGDFVTWVSSDTENPLANLNILNRRFDKFDIHTEGEISIDDANEIFRFFHRPPLAAQQIETLIDDHVTFLEFAKFLLGDDHPLTQLALNEYKRMFFQYSPEEEKISSDCLTHAAEYYDTEWSRFESTGMDGMLTFHEFCKWVSSQKRVRPPLNEKIPSLNVLQKRFNFSVDTNLSFAPYAQVSEEAAIKLCRFFGENLEATIFAAEQSPNGRVMFHELVRMLLRDKDKNPLWHLKLNDLKLTFEENDRDGVGKLTLHQFEEAAHFLQLPQSFQDAKEAEHGLTFTGFLSWIVKTKPEVFPPLDLTLKRNYTNYQPTFSSLRRRFNEMDSEILGFISIDAAKELFRYFDFNVTALAEARSLYHQEQEGVPEEDREAITFASQVEAFMYLLPPPLIDEDGSELPLELTFQDFCRMTFFPTDTYFEVDTLNELKDWFDALEANGGDEGFISEKAFFACIEGYYMTEEERADLSVVNHKLTFNEFVRKLAFCPKSFIGFAVKQSRKKGRECMGGCVIS